MPKRSRSGVVIRPERVVAPTSVKGASCDLHRARRRPLADHQIEFVILHRGIENFLHRRIEAVDLVDEQNVARLEIGENGGEIARLGQHRAGGGAEIDAQLARHDLRQGGLAQARRAGEQHMVQRLAARLGGLDEDGEIFARLLLADEIGQPLGAQDWLPASRLRRVPACHETVVRAALPWPSSVPCPSALRGSAHRRRRASPRSRAARATASAAWPSE